MGVNLQFQFDVKKQFYSETKRTVCSHRPAAKNSRAELSSSWPLSDYREKSRKALSKWFCFTFQEATYPSSSTLSVSEPIPVSPLPESHTETLEEFHTQLEIPIEKLFVPPETELSYTESGALSTRILKGSNILLSKYARDAQVTRAEFVKSSVRTEDCPANGLPEFALVGRSNVGKSSLLNSLVRRKKLALTSKKPG